MNGSKRVSSIEVKTVKNTLQTVDKRKATRFLQGFSWIYGCVVTMVKNKCKQRKIQLTLQPKKPNQTIHLYNTHKTKSLASDKPVED